MEEARWMAVYEDGTNLLQFPREGEENSFGDIEQDKLKEFVLVINDVIIGVNPKNATYFIRNETFTPMTSNVFTVPFDFDTFEEHNGEARLVYFVRRTKHFNQTNGDLVGENSAYHVGLQLTKEDKNIIRLIRYNNGKISIIDKK